MRRVHPLHKSSRLSVCAFAAVLLAVSALGQSPRMQLDPARDQWQRPAEVMDALRIRAGSTVADVGAGEGYFTSRLAERVGPHGKVYAEDIDFGALARLKAAAEKNGLQQVEVVQGTESDPKLPEGALDAVLIVNAYHEMDEHDAMLHGLLRALKPGGLLGIIDKEAETGHPRGWYHSHHRIALEVVKAETAKEGFRFVGTRPGFTRADDQSKWWFAIFEK
jgi:predicted methyltransferase